MRANKIFLITDKFVIVKSIEKRLNRMGYRMEGPTSRLDDRSDSDENN